MLKIIELSSPVSQELIEKYSGNSQMMQELYLDNGKYTIDSINEYLNFFSHAKGEGEIAIGVITEGEKLTEYHQNKLLKTFEDSSDDEIHLVFIDRSDRLLATILSRAIIYREVIEFKFVDSKMHNFAKPLITSIDSYNLLIAEDEIFQKLYRINRMLNNSQFEQAIIVCDQIKFDRPKFSLFIRLVEDYLYHNKRLDLLKYLYQIELKCKYQVNLNLQVQDLLIEIKNNKEYYERSNWN